MAAELTPETMELPVRSRALDSDVFPLVHAFFASVSVTSLVEAVITSVFAAPLLFVLSLSVGALPETPLAIITSPLSIISSKVQFAINNVCPRYDPTK